MDDLIEMVLEIIMDVSIELLPNKKVPKWVRIIISLVLIGMIIGIIILGAILLKESILGGTILLVVGIFLLVGIVIKIRQYLKD